MRLNIHFKITLIFSSITALILFGIFIYLNNNLKEHTFNRIRTNLLKESGLAGSVLEKYYSGPPGSYRLDEIAGDIGKQLGLRATIIGLDGTVYGDSELDGEDLTGVENHLYRPEVQQALRSGSGESERFSTTVKKNMLYVARLYGKDRPQGMIRLSMPLSEIDMIPARLKKLLAISLVIAFLFSIAISHLLSVFISRPIEEMSRRARGMARGDFSRKISIRTNDEIEDLASAFNYMSEQVRSRIEEVTASRYRMEAVLLSMFEGLMVVDPKGTILLMNQALRDFLMVEADALGRRPIEVIRNIEVQEIVDKALSLKKGVESREISVLIPEEKTLLVHATPIAREDRLEGAVLVFHDITELRRLEKVRQDFVANVSHELRTPVASIKGYAETLLEGALEEKENARDFVKIIYSDSERLARLVDDLLDLSKIESGKLKMNLKPCHVRPIVERVVSGLNIQAKEMAVRIDIAIPENTPYILADEVHIAQVFLNLINNAIIYNNKGGTVTVAAKEKGDLVQIDVSDTGIGISEKDLPRVFERFYRVDKGRSRESGGTGLGLSIVKHIAQAHNGEVFVKSVLGEGSTFSFTIPKA